MAATTVNVQMQQRRDTAANWSSANPTLLEGELGFETDTKKAKLGDGSSAWNSLSYYPGFSISGYPLATSDIADDAIGILNPDAGHLLGGQNLGAKASGLSRSPAGQIGPA